MARIVVHVEGQTEETFVNEVLAGHLLAHGHTITARLIGNAQRRAGRGGGRGWDSVYPEIVRHLTGDPRCYATTMVDYYALRQSGSGAWPGRAEANGKTFAEKGRTVQDALLADIARRMGDRFDPRRFIPYVVMHEFEGLLFSDCARFAAAIHQNELTGRFQEIRDAFATPEEINDSLETAPSKRVAALVPGYEKPLMGNLAALEIGLNAMRQQCPLFNEWVTRLEALP